MRRIVGAGILTGLAVAGCDSSPTMPTEPTGFHCGADVEMVDWRHYRDPPGSAAVYFNARFRITGAEPGCVADLDFRWKLKQRDRVISVRGRGHWMYAPGRETDVWWIHGPTGDYIGSLPYSGPYSISWTWAWCWRVTSLARRQECTADEPD